MNRQVRAAWAEYHRTLRLRTGRAGPREIELARKLARFADAGVVECGYQQCSCWAVAA